MPDLPLRNNDATDETQQAELQWIFAKLDLFLRKEYSFLDTALTVNSLSGYAGIAPKRISYAISESEFDNFNDYINHLRIEYATNKIQNGYLDLYSVEALSETSGFNSKNAFYRAFKKIHGCTPGKYFLRQKMVQPN